MTHDGRRDPRKPTILQIRFKNATISEFIEKHSRDISRGGFFIKMKTPFPAGTLIKFDVRIAENAMIHGVGRVVWCRTMEEGESEPPGMGVKFIKLDEKSRRVLEAVLAEKDPRAEAETPLFDDALPKPKVRVHAPITGSVPPVKPGKSATSVPKPSSDAKHNGVSLSEDTRKIPLKSIRPPEDSTQEEAETVVASPAQLRAALGLAKGQPAGETEKLLAGSKDKFMEDISTAISTALNLKEVVDDAPARTASPSDENDGWAPVGKEISAPVVRRRPPNVGIVLGLSIAALAAVGFAVVLINGSPQEQGNAAVSEQAGAPVTEAVHTASSAALAGAPAPVEGGEEAGRLTIETEPGGATVTMGGIRQPGVTPLSLDALPMGKPVTVAIQRFGFKPMVTQLEPTASPQRITLPLEPASLAIEINSTPDDATIYLDGREAGATPRVMTPDGPKSTMTIKIEKEGYLPFSKETTEGDWTYEEGVQKLVIKAKLERATSASASRRSRYHSTSSREPAAPQAPLTGAEQAEKPEPDDDAPTGAASGGDSRADSKPTADTAPISGAPPEERAAEPEEATEQSAPEPPPALPPEKAPEPEVRPEPPPADEPESAIEENPF